MANFSNYSKLQIITSRQGDLGSDATIGGTTVSSLLTITGAATAGSIVTILGTAVTNLITEDPTAIGSNIDRDFTATPITGLTVTDNTDGTLLFTWDEATFVGTIPSLDPTIVVEDGVTYTFSAYADTRDAPAVLMKHSEYEDSETGMSAAIAALYALVLSSPSTDASQLQRIKLDDTNITLVTTPITANITGQAYTAYISP